MLKRFLSPVELFSPHHFEVVLKLRLVVPHVPSQETSFFLLSPLQIREALVCLVRQNCNDDRLTRESHCFPFQGMVSW